MYIINVLLDMLIELKQPWVYGNMSRFYLYMFHWILNKYVSVEGFALKRGAISFNCGESKGEAWLEHYSTTMFVHDPTKVKASIVNQVCLTAHKGLVNSDMDEIYNL